MDSLVGGQAVIDGAQACAWTHVEVRRRQIMTVMAEIDCLIGNPVEFSAKFGGDGTEHRPESGSVKVSDRQINVAGVAVIPGGMYRKPPREDVDFRGKRIHPFVSVQADHRQPEFAPGRYGQNPTRLGM